MNTRRTKPKSDRRRSRWYIFTQSECKPHLFVDGKCLYCGKVDMRAKTYRVARLANSD
jgi:hypothetical protein